jgi:hypothetical protein
LIDLNELTDSELLSLRICDLPISFEDSQYGHLLEKLYKELDKKKILFRPRIWLSDDWFCPDGVTGFAVPFFLMHPRLIELERKMMGEVEGEGESWFMKLLRHECGHAIDNAYFLKDCQIRTAVFGDSNIEYPESYIPKKYSKKYVIHLEDGYAQAHPEEDWAETFALWLTPRSAWKKKYQNWPALKKLDYVDQKMKELKNQRANVICYQHVDEIETLDISLRTYYNRKKERFKLNLCESHLNKFLLDKRKKHEGERLDNEIKKNRKSLKRYLSKSLASKNYEAESVLRDLEKLAKTKGLYVKKGRPIKKLEGIVNTHAKKFFKEGKHRVIM